MTKDEIKAGLASGSLKLVKLDDAKCDWQDFSKMKLLTCVNHPTALYSTKNPWQRHLHILDYPEDCQGECPCGFADLRVIESA